MDEIANAVGRDPFEYRIAQLEDERAIGVLKKLREQLSASGLETEEANTGVGIAMAQYKNAGAYCAVAMQVYVNPADGKTELRRCVCAVDVGMAVNPDGVINQTEGGIIQAASWTVKEQMRIGTEGVRSKEWGSYPILTFAEVPAIDVALVERPGDPSLGAGEAAHGPTAAAIANAVAKATGKRIRDLPLTPARLKDT